MQLPIFLINLDSDINRLKFMTHQFEYLNLTENVERVQAIDMRNISESNIIQNPQISWFTKFTIQKKHRCDHKQIDSTGAIGSTLSHYKVWKKIIDENIEMAIVMEDDMRLMMDFPIIIENEIQKYKNNFDMINLGFHKNMYSEIKNSRFFFNAGCYIITRKGCQILCQNVFPIEVHVDAFFFLMNHFSLFKMILSKEIAVTPQNGVQTNIDHGFLNCNDQTTLLETKQKLRDTQIVGICLGFLLFLSICFHGYLFHKK